MYYLNITNVIVMTIASGVGELERESGPAISLHLFGSEIKSVLFYVRDK